MSSLLSVLGCHTSHWKGFVDVNKLVENDVKYIYPKTTHGSGPWVDPRFEETWANTRDALFRGPWHWLVPGVDPVVAKRIKKKLNQE